MITENNRPSNTGWWQYIMAANATGGGSVFLLLIGLAVGFGWGYHTKHKQHVAHSAEIVNQALNNKNLDKQTSNHMTHRNNDLVTTLMSLGYTTDEVDYLISGDVKLLTRIKNKFKNMVGDKDHEPNPNCEDDYLGPEASDEINEHIMNRFNKRPGDSQ